MGEFNFNRRQCTRALQKLSFMLSNKRNGIHDKYAAPQHIAKNLVGAVPRFIMVPRHKELRCQLEIISELKKLGGDDLVAAFKSYL